MKTYIVNLPKDNDRKEYVSRLLSEYEWMDKEFIAAVYGKELSEDEINKVFDLEQAYRRYGRRLNPGEIGCTLSHHLCYQKLLDSEEEWALLLEDDITILRDINTVPEVVKGMDARVPSVVFLSGDYWFTKMQPSLNGLKVASVYDAVGTYAYLINRKAAELITRNNPRPSYVADNWSLFRKQGVHLFALNPYLIDANIESFESSIEQNYFGEVRKNMPLNYRIAAYRLALVKKLLVRSGHFVSKIRK